jgi:hypothetical protein
MATIQNIQHAHLHIKLFISPRGFRKDYVHTFQNTICIHRNLSAVIAAIGVNKARHQLVPLKADNLLLCRATECAERARASFLFVIVIQLLELYIQSLCTDF